jgi:predicted nuclease of restriction endonuclease-like (RecB) superfamily
VSDLPTRRWYMEQTLANGWSRDVLSMAIGSDAYRRRGGAVTNFDQILPAPQSDLAQQTLKDPYIFNFITFDKPFHERELETNLIHHLE